MIDTTHYHQLFKEKKCCVIIPTYNNDFTLTAIINDVLAYTSDIIVVDDGSTDSTSEILKSFPHQYFKYFKIIDKLNSANLMKKASIDLDSLATIKFTSIHKDMRNL